ncbi:MAG: hypothetical protein M3M95_00540, partial [Pseudomonadota bacterium]|nr:hypothetical protein [Pseudomonadota bacterium]
SWSWENGDTDLSFTRGQSASRRFALAPWDVEEWSFDFSHAFYNGAWDGAAYAYASSADTEMPGGGSAETFFGGGVTANLRAERFPDASVSLALDRFDALYEGFPEVGGDRSLDLRLDLDFSKYLPQRGGGAAPYLTAGYYVQRALSRRSEFFPLGARPQDWDHAVFIAWGTPF